jgi:hypothetical protein
MEAGSAGKRKTEPRSAAITSWPRRRRRGRQVRGAVVAAISCDDRGGVRPDNYAQVRLAQVCLAQVRIWSG